MDLGGGTPLDFFVYMRNRLNVKGLVQIFMIDLSKRTILCVDFYDKFDKFV